MNRDFSFRDTRPWSLRNCGRVWFQWLWQTYHVVRRVSSSSSQQGQQHDRILMLLSKVHQVHQYHNILNRTIFVLIHTILFIGMRRLAQSKVLSGKIREMLELDTAPRKILKDAKEKGFLSSGDCWQSFPQKVSCILFRTFSSFFALFFSPFLHHF